MSSPMSPSQHHRRGHIGDYQSVALKTAEDRLGTWAKPNFNGTSGEPTSYTPSTVDSRHSLFLWLSTQTSVPVRPGEKTFFSPATVSPHAFVGRLYPEKEVWRKDWNDWVLGLEGMKLFLGLEIYV